MLHSKNLYSTLAQCVTPDASSDRAIVSSILITSVGQTIASCHSSREPPPPKTFSSKFGILNDSEDSSICLNKIAQNETNTFSSEMSNNSQVRSSIDPATDKHDPNTSSNLSQNAQQSLNFRVSRSGKTRVYTLFASSAWQNYKAAGISKNVLSPPVVAPISDSISNCTFQTPNYLQKKSSRSVKNYDKKRKPSINKSTKTQINLPNKTETTSNGCKERDWIYFVFDDSSKIGAAIFIIELNLQESQQKLLLILVSDGDCPMGTVLKKAEEAAAVLEHGLSSYTVSEP